MASAELLGDGVYHLDTGYIKPGVASFYCIIEQGSAAIVETGAAQSLPNLQRFLGEMEIAADQVRYVVPTHVHLDHAGGAGAMMQAFPEAELVIHPRGARHMIDPQKLVAATREVYGEKVFNRLYGDIPAIDEDRVIKAEHGFSFDLNGREIHIIDTPGHAFHHFCVVDPTSKGIFSGDTFGLSYPGLRYQGERFIIPTTTPSQFSPEHLHQSIDLIMAQGPEKMYLTHFNMLPSPAAHVDQYRHLLDKYVALTESIQPLDDYGLEALTTAIGDLLGKCFDLPRETIDGKLKMDVQLNAQGLAIWYRRRLEQ
jgi:glyoxylase-like metal-dependent hydrolase (beta-lactamase superfamily II)